MLGIEKESRDLGGAPVAYCAKTIRFHPTWLNLCKYSFGVYQRQLSLKLTLILLKRESQFTLKERQAETSSVKFKVKLNRLIAFDSTIETDYTNKKAQRCGHVCSFNEGYEELKRLIENQSEYSIEMILKFTGIKGASKLSNNKNNYILPNVNKVRR